MQLPDLLSAKRVTYHPYRTALVYDRICQETAERNSENSDLRLRLAELSGKGIDNHTCYTVEFESGKCVYFQFSDFMMYVGLTLEMKEW